ncbi:MAG: hypothetical protein J6T26_08025 [Firmicutes bacterium]|nr:hypothetical protein [Bacillota bacterium]
MAKYVDVEPLIEEYTKSINYVTTHATKMNIMEFANGGACFETARKTLMDAPAADVAPVRHGRWFLDGDYEYINCSKCLNPFYMGFDTSSDARQYLLREDKWKYCPNCGAKMDGSEEVR